MIYLDFLSHSSSYQFAQSINLSKKGGTLDPNEKNLKKICSQFEAIFLSYLFLQMKKTIPESGPLREEFAHRIYEEEFYTLLAEKLAEQGGVGLAKILYRELKNKMKENSGGQNGGNKRTNQGFKKTASSL